jgi:outer membrane protein
MKKVTMTLATAIMLLGCKEPVEGAQDQKIGVVNFKAVVEKSKAGKKEQQNFEMMKKQMESVLEEKEKTMSDIANKLNDPDYLDSLSPEAEAEIKHKFRSLSQEMQQHQNQYYQILNQANFQVIQKLGESISDAAKVVAKDKKLDLVLNQEMSFYHADSLNISEEVVKVMDQQFKEDK